MWRSKLHRLRSKACIDQTRIEDSLAGLPVYVSGCKRLLVLCGRTYTSRLWCIMEVFTFLVMGAEKDRVELKRISDAPEISEALMHFRTSAAQCYLQEDRQRMLAIIESAFGTHASFDDAVRRLLVGAVAPRPNRVQATQTEARLKLTPISRHATPRRRLKSIVPTSRKRLTSFLARMRRHSIK
jgi:hypothetical protein